MSKKVSSLLLSFNAVLWLGYSWFSYALTAPNLILSSWGPYWRWQLWMWETFFNNRVLLTHWYLVLITALISCYLLILKFLPRSVKWWYWALLYAAILLIANNALSYDVFNYIFNAKMVWIYHANPHIKVALDFAYDDWVRFMHNTHTPAPYGYGWTALSLVPFLLGFQKLLPTWLAFRAWSVVSIALLGLSIWWHSRQTKKPLSLDLAAWLFLNPLFLIEIISNSHNDLWMIVPAMVSLSIVSSNRSITKVILSGLLLAASVSIKFASLTLVPLWGMLILTSFFFHKKNSAIKLFFKNWWPLLASICLFVPLLTARSQQFHPWYLTWVMPWLVLLDFQTTKGFINGLMSKLARAWLISLTVLSASSLYRYAPYLLQGNFTDELILKQKMISWIPFVIALLISLGYVFLRRPARSSLLQ